MTLNTRIDFECAAVHQPEARSAVRFPVTNTIHIQGLSPEISDSFPRCYAAINKSAQAFH